MQGVSLSVSCNVDMHDVSFSLLSAGYSAFDQSFLMPECQTVRHMVSAVFEWKNASAVPK
jgi:hypothetical protein